MMPRGRSMNKEKLIIFVCTGNTCRSPMAEALFNKVLEDKGHKGINVISRGLSAFDGEEASQNAVAVMREFGCDISFHRSCSLTRQELDADLFVCMTEGHAVVLSNFGISKERLYVMDIPDPYGRDLDEYRLCAEKIYLGLEKVYELIK